MEIVSPTHLLPNCVPPSVAILESFLWEAFPATCQAPSLESCSMEDKAKAGGEKLQESLIGREEGQGLLPGFRFLPPLGLPLLIYLMASLSPSHPCLPPLLVSFSLSLISPLSLSCFFSPVWSLHLSLLLSILASVFSLFLPVSLSSLSLSLCLCFGVSLCASVSLLPASLPISLPYLSLSTVKKAKFDGAQGKWPLYLPVLCCLSICLSISWRDGKGSEPLVGDLCPLSITESVRHGLWSQQSPHHPPENPRVGGAHPEPMALSRIPRDNAGLLDQALGGESEAQRDEGVSYSHLCSHRGPRSFQLKTKAVGRSYF